MAVIATRMQSNNGRRSNTAKSDLMMMIENYNCSLPEAILRRTIGQQLSM